jgi:hypothetical protein
MWTTKMQMSQLTMDIFQFLDLPTERGVAEERN